MKKPPALCFHQLIKGRVPNHIKFILEALITKMNVKYHIDVENSVFEVSKFKFLGGERRISGDTRPAVDGGRFGDYAPCSAGSLTMSGSPFRYGSDEHICERNQNDISTNFLVSRAFLQLNVSPASFKTRKYPRVLKHKNFRNCCLYNLFAGYVICAHI